jgi:hypothetical protein
MWRTTILLKKRFAAYNKGVVLLIPNTPADRSHDTLAGSSS